MFLRFSKVYFYCYTLMLVIAPMLDLPFPWVKEILGSTETLAWINLSVAHFAMYIFIVLTLIFMVCAMRIEWWVRSWNK